MSANNEYFKESGTYLRARGFDLATGDKSGGIIDPKIIRLEAGSILYRLFHLNDRKYGEWWSTAYELSRIFSYFGREGLSAATGRSSGKGILHATLAVRHDWSIADTKDLRGRPSSHHLGQFLCATPIESITAYYGPGDDAPSDNKQNVQKAALILTESGNQVRARQLFIPKCWEYVEKFNVIDEGATDTNLISSINKHLKGRLEFE